jgi:predicted pyridoxine 5'-phosphate oxidase superfamily flavin-nucleotide-binding protein
VDNPAKNTETMWIDPENMWISLVRMWITRRKTRHFCGVNDDKYGFLVNKLEDSVDK